MAYTVPTPADLQAYYPAFAAVPDATIQLYIDRAAPPSGSGGDVDRSWIEGDYAPAIMAAAAHRMSRNGVLGSSGGMAGVEGLESFRSASVSLQFSAEAVKAQVAGGWGSTRYGLEYLELLTRNRAGPRVAGSGAGYSSYGFNGYAGPLGYPAALWPYP